MPDPLYREFLVQYEIPKFTGSKELHWINWAVFRTRGEADLSYQSLNEKFPERRRRILVKSVFADVVECNFKPD